VILHVSWYDTVYFMQFKDIFETALQVHSKVGFDPTDAKITHFRHTETGDLEEVKELNDSERYAESIKGQVEFLRVFRDGTIEKTCWALVRRSAGKEVESVIVEHSLLFPQPRDAWRRPTTAEGGGARRPQLSATR
jgi:hypothetical protein